MVDFANAPWNWQENGTKRRNLVKITPNVGQIWENRVAQFIDDVEIYTGSGITANCVHAQWKYT
jgi:hypothetical protein